MRRFLIGIVALVLALAAGACGSSSKSSSSTTTAPSPGFGGLSGSINVLAASSLTEGFNALGTEFEAAHPGAKVNLSYGSSSDLETQIEQGAPADVFASADQSNMDKVVAAQANGGAP